MSLPTTAPEAYDAFAIAVPGLEALLQQELRALGVRASRVEDGGVAFRASHDTLYRVNLRSRIASRVIVRIANFHANSFSELERRSRRLPWERLLAPSTGLHLRVTCRKSRLYHSDAVAERIFEAAARKTNATLKEETDEDNAPPDESVPDAQLLIVRLLHDQCSISLDSSGALLHRRGYRLWAGKAPLRENIAAAVVIASGWPSDPTTPLLDPFCGSGTISIEAALIARRIPPGMNRRFAFEFWPDFDADAWARVRAAATSGVYDGPMPPILGSDRDAGAARYAAENAVRAGVGADISFTRQNVSAVAPPTGIGWLVSNPPYGVRVGERDALLDLYARFGTHLRAKFVGWHVALLSGNRRLGTQLRIPLAERLRTVNGGLKVALLAGVVSGGNQRTEDRATSGPNFGHGNGL